MFIIKLLYAVFGITMAIGILKYRKNVYSWTGKFYWAEKYIGSWGTILVIILFGLGLMFVSMLYPFGYFDKEISTSAPMQEATQNQITE